MRKTAVRKGHLVASILAIAIILGFQVTTIVVELAGDIADVRAAKRTILYGLIGLIPCLIGAGISGRTLAGKGRGPLIRRKMRRMQFIAAIGLLVLVPCAITLDILAGKPSLDTAFVVLQYIELAGGLTNLTLLALNFRDGWTVRTRRLRAAN